MRVSVTSRHGPTRFDWADAATWPDALAGTEGVFIVGPGSATDWSPLLASLLTTARASGARHAVLLSARAAQFVPGGIRRGADAYLSDGVQAVLGRPPTAFREWARREVPAAAWAQARNGGEPAA